MAPEIRITVWRPVSWDGEYLDTTQGAPASPSSLHEPVYTYEINDSPFDGVLSADITASLREELVRFGPEQPIDQRSIRCLREMVSKIHETLNANEIAWVDSPEEVLLAADETPVQKRQNRLLAFASRLQWLCDTFEAIPEISVSIR